jgi:hypothetical protein
MAEIKKILKNKNIGAIILILALGAALFVFGSYAKGTSKNSASGSVNQKDVSEIASACKELRNREQCYSKAFGALTTETNMQHSFEVLRELQQVDPAARGCHLIAHAISTAETVKDPSKWREIMNSAPQDCSYGAAHGALEVHSASMPDGKLPKSEIPTICNNPDTNNCTHILGHLLLIVNDNKIPESIKECESLPHNDMGKFECLTGIFMERITALNLVEHGLADESYLNWPARMPELEKLCREQTGTASVACWKEIAHAALVKFNNNPQMIVNFCETAPGETETRECIDHSLGILGSVYNFELDKMGHICEVRAKAPGFKNRCYAQLVSATISTTPGQIPEAVKFCSNIGKEFQETCFTMLGNSLHSTDPAHKKILNQECAHAPSEFRQRCEFGGNSNIQFYSGGD